MNRPSSMKLAVALMVIALAFSIVSVSFNIVNAPEHYSRPFMIGYGSLRILLIGGLIYLLYLGKNWARIIYAAFGAISLATNVTGPNPLGVHHKFVAVNHWIGLAITLFVMVLLFVPASNQWFAENKAHA